MSQQTSATAWGRRDEPRSTEALKGGCILARCGEDDLALIQVHKQADVIVPVALGGLIHSYPHDSGQVHLLPGGMHVVIEHAPQAGIVLADG